MFTGPNSPVSCSVRRLIVRGACNCAPRDARTILSSVSSSFLSARIHNVALQQKTVLIDCQNGGTWVWKATVDGSETCWDSLILTGIDEILCALMEMAVAMASWIDCCINERITPMMLERWPAGRIWAVYSMVFVKCDACSCPPISRFGWAPFSFRLSSCLHSFLSFLLRRFPPE